MQKYPLKPATNPNLSLTKLVVIKVVIDDEGVCEDISNEYASAVLARLQDEAFAMSVEVRQTTVEEINDVHAVNIIPQ